MLRDPAPAVHALLRVADLDALTWEAHRPQWASAALQFAPWAVVRRAAPRLEVWPVGVRGGQRQQRCAAWLPDRAIQDCITPQMLVAKRAWRQRPSATLTPAVGALDEVAEILVAHGFAGLWGPSGSVGFELASGVLSTTPGSDLDLVLKADEPVARTDAIRLHADLSKLPVRIDLLLETPYGAMALAEYAKDAGATLMRCAQGPRLVRDPWSADSAKGGTL
jgi:phosphoribosyl-dephospho-CoA transferase